MDKREKNFDITGGMLTAYPWIRFIAPEYSGYNMIQNLNAEIKLIIKVFYFVHHFLLFFAFLKI